MSRDTKIDWLVRCFEDERAGDLSISYKECFAYLPQRCYITNRFLWLQKIITVSLYYGFNNKETIVIDYNEWLQILLMT